MTTRCSVDAVPIGSVRTFSVTSLTFPRCRGAGERPPPAGFLVQPDGALLPADPSRQRAWRLAVQDVSERRVPRFFMLRSEPDWIVAALVPGDGGAVHVRLSESAVADDRRLQAAAVMLGLTRREAEVLQRLMEGGSAKSISRRLGTSESTVRTQLSALRCKSGLALRDLVRRVATLPALEDRGRGEADAWGVVRRAAG